MTRTPLMLVLGAAAALAGCHKENHTIVAGPDTGDNTVEANAPVALPPAVTASKIYRCADNKVIYVDWLSDNKSANIRTQQAGTPTQVTAAEPGKAMTAAGGYEINGTSGASSVKIAIPGHASQSCNV
jgi:hypothetical protein